MTKRDASTLARLAAARGAAPRSAAGYVGAVRAATAVTLSLDPSSKVTGFAVFKGNNLVAAGKLLPRRTRDDANARIRAMSVQLARLVGRFEPTVFVMEDTSGKVGKRHHGAGAGLAIHGKAVGYLACTIEALKHIGAVQMVAENEWARGRPKAVRAQQTALTYRGKYDPEQDKGGDVADAIGLGDWFLAQRRAEQCV